MDAFDRAAIGMPLTSDGDVERDHVAVVVDTLPAPSAKRSRRRRVNARVTPTRRCLPCRRAQQRRRCSAAFLQRDAPRMVRRLTRRAKTRAAVVQLGLCAYCAAPLPEGFHCDHMNARHWDDRAINLAAACGNCHAHKTLLERSAKRAGELHAMLRAARRVKRDARAHCPHGRRRHRRVRCDVAGVATPALRPTQPPAFLQAWRVRLSAPRPIGIAFALARRSRRYTNKIMRLFRVLSTWLRLRCRRAFRNTHCIRRRALLCTVRAALLRRLIARPPL